MPCLKYRPRARTEAKAMRFGFGAVFAMCDCAAQIERAMTTGHPGLAEYLSERCDRQHGELSDTPANATAAAGTENDEREDVA